MWYKIDVIGDRKSFNFGAWKQESSVIANSLLRGRNKEELPAGRIPLSFSAGKTAYRGVLFHTIPSRLLSGTPNADAPPLIKMRRNPHIWWKCTPSTHTRQLIVKYASGTSAGLGAALWDQNQSLKHTGRVGPAIYECIR